MQYRRRQVAPTRATAATASSLQCGSRRALRHLGLPGRCTGDPALREGLNKKETTYNSSSSGSSSMYASNLPSGFKISAMR
jgi:hypothetical protein